MSRDPLRFGRSFRIPAVPGSQPGCWRNVISARTRKSGIVEPKKLLKGPLRNHHWFGLHGPNSSALERERRLRRQRWTKATPKNYRSMFLFLGAML